MPVVHRKQANFNSGSMPRSWNLTTGKIQNHSYVINDSFILRHHKPYIYKVLAGRKTVTAIVYLNAVVNKNLPSSDSTVGRTTARVTERRKNRCHIVTRSYCKAGISDKEANTGHYSRPIAHALALAGHRDDCGVSVAVRQQHCRLRMCCNS